MGTPSGATTGVGVREAKRGPTPPIVSATAPGGSRRRLATLAAPLPHDSRAPGEWGQSPGSARATHKALRPPPTSPSGARGPAQPSRGEPTRRRSPSRPSRPPSCLQAPPRSPHPPARSEPPGRTEHQQPRARTKAPNSGT